LEAGRLGGWEAGKLGESITACTFYFSPQAKRSSSETLLKDRRSARFSFPLPSVLVAQSCFFFPLPHSDFRIPKLSVLIFIPIFRPSHLLNFTPSYFLTFLTSAFFRLPNSAFRLRSNLLIFSTSHLLFFPAYLQHISPKYSGRPVWLHTWRHQLF
jgi:hypothetical protein